MTLLNDVRIHEILFPVKLVLAGTLFFKEATVLCTALAVVYIAIVLIQ